MLILQLTDFHVAPGDILVGGIDTRIKFARTLASVARLDPQPDLIVVTGDLADSGTDEEYAVLAAGLRGLGLPFVVVPGNHDLREPLRRAFPEETGREAGHLAFQRHFGGILVIGLDTLMEGQAHGALSEEQLDWLETVVGGTDAVPTLIVMHHPPCPTGIPSMDAIGLEKGGDRLAALLGSRSNVVGILCGHVHRPIFARFAHLPVMIAPSASYQFELDFERAGRFEIVQEPPQFVLHRVCKRRGTITTYLTAA